MCGCPQSPKLRCRPKQCSSVPPFFRPRCAPASRFVCRLRIARSHDTPMLAFSKGGCTLIPCTPAPQTRAWGAGGVPHKAAPCQQQQRRSSKDGWPGSRRLATAQRQRRAQSLVPKAAARKPGGLREQLPIFPLGLVALPATEVPLQIFEASNIRVTWLGWSRQPASSW